MQVTMLRIFGCLPSVCANILMRPIVRALLQDSLAFQSNYPV